MLDIKALFTKILTKGVFKDANNDVLGIRNISCYGVTSAKQYTANGAINPSTSPSATKYDVGLTIKDSNGTRIGQIETYQSTSNALGVDMNVTRPVNGSNVFHTLLMYINADGTRKVYVQDSKPWRDGFGLSNIADSSGGISVTGSASVSGTVTCSGHDSAIGYVQVTEGSSSLSDVSQSAGAYVTIGTITLSAGTWVITCQARFEPSASGDHYSGVVLGATSTADGWYDRRYGASTYQNQHSFTVIRQPTASQTYYLRGNCTVAGKWLRQNTTQYSIRAVRIR